MFNNKKIGVVVPALNEEELIADTLNGIPSYVDCIYVINDGSEDDTFNIVNNFIISDSRFKQIVHETRMGLGRSLIDGYAASINDDCDIIAVMAGDNQMHPEDLVNIIRPIVDGVADYTKGNRLLNQDTWGKMPKYRFIGNSILSILTKFATGYWKSIDPQCGYTAISKEALIRIPYFNMLKGYGYNASILYMLNLKDLKVTDVKVKAVYGKEKSKIKIINYILVVTRLLGELFVKRVFIKYIVIDFHPLSIFYLFGIFGVFFLSLPLAIRVLYKYIELTYIPTTSLLLFIFTSMMSIQFILTAISMDIDENKSLWVRGDKLNK